MQSYRFASNYTEGHIVTHTPEHDTLVLMVDTAANTKHIYFACIFAGLLLVMKSCFIMLKPVEALGMTPWLIDDSFIVMRIARNIALGKGFSFDDLNPTTGVSMLWTYLTSINHVLFAKEAAVKATLIESTVFGSLNTILVFLITYRITKNGMTAWIALVLSSLLPVAFFNAMNGMETSIFTLFILLTASTYVEIGRPSRIANAQWGCVVGLCAGMAILTRADGIFVLIGIGLMECAELLRKDKKTWKKECQKLLGIIVGSAICFLVLIGWQLATTGSPLPANQIGRRAIAMTKHGFSYQDFPALRYAKIAAWNAFELEKLFALALTSGVLGLLALAYGIVKKETAKLAWLTLLYLGSFGCVLILYQWYFPDFHGLRYINPGIHLLSILIAMLIASLPPHRLRIFIIAIVIAATLKLAWYNYVAYPAQLAWTTDMDLFARVTKEERDAFWASAQWLQKNTPEYAVIGLRDHGRIAFMSDRPIQDLAGIIDPEVLIHWKDGTIGNYLQEKNMSYAFLPLPDESSDTIYQAIHKAMTLMAVEGAPAQSTTGFRLYKVGE